MKSSDFVAKSHRHFWLPQLLCIPHHVYAQRKEVTSEFAVWQGLFLNTRIAERNSIFTDFHLIPGAFGVARFGLTQHLTHGVDATAGFAHLWLTVPSSGSDALKRKEHRPWMQVVVPSSIGKNLSLSTRFRYDMRYRQRVEASELQPKYDLTHRLRLQETLRLNLPRLKTGEVLPYLALSDEVLLNFGRYVTHNTFDQNRLSLMLGLQPQALRLQTGYMNRFTQSATVPNRYTHHHTLVIWLFYNLDLRKAASAE